jgi:hypothetical protein
MSANPTAPEEARLAEAREQGAPWRAWGLREAAFQLEAARARIRARG